jgi:deazaflavin-dependent oxidoreductase (nitroreductase family)
MWFMNKIANPFVRLILRSPLHGMMSAAVLLITYRGRKSGKEYTLPVQYVQDGNHIYMVPGFPEKKTWWRNLKGGMSVRLTLKGKTLSGNGTLLEHETDLEKITKGFSLYLQQFPSVAKMHNVRIEADNTFNAEDLRRAAKNVVMIRVELQMKAG